MKKSALTVILGVLVLFAPILAWGEDGDTSPKPDMPFKTQRRIADLGAGCRFAVELILSERGGIGEYPETGEGIIAINPRPYPQGGFSDDSTSGFSLQLTCKNEGNPYAPQIFGFYDKSVGKWIKDEQKLPKELMKQQGYDISSYVSPEDEAPFDRYAKTFRVYNITAKNAPGWAYTYKDIDWDEKTRQKHLNFCIYHANKVLCGFGDVGYLEEGAEGDLTQRALEIIRSIEFLD
ncbi:MAG: hypothetical protein LBG66_01110 [Gallionellaceae bacterium]|jgi:hypothetical protein|nr:hypothetical protein [Gallionellaceae bacterium]